MNNAEQYFNKQKQNPEFITSYNSISEKVDIEWELEKVQKYIKEDYSKSVILEHLSKLQSFIHQATFVPQKTMV